MAVKVGINGFGRIGRNIMRAAMGDKNIDFVAVNDLTNAAHARPSAEVRLGARQPPREGRGQGDSISVDGDEFKVLSLRDPAQLPWKDLGVDVVFESTGLFTEPRRRPPSTSRRAPRKSSSPRRPKGRTSRSSSA